MMDQSIKFYFRLVLFQLSRQEEINAIYANKALKSHLFHAEKAVLCISNLVY